MYCCSALFYATGSLANEHAVILQYHHVGEDTPRSTTVSTEQFRQHMQYLKQHHQVVPLDKLVKQVRNNQPVADNAVAITFDDGYLNILQNAHPILQEYKFPYTIFINPDEIGQRHNQLDWQQVHRLSQQNVLFANHTMDHLHLLQKQPNESSEAWLTRITGNIEKAEKKLQDELGYSLKYLAYPYGEYNLRLQQWLEQSHYVAFGQHSGAFSNLSNFTALPRFPAAGAYADMDKLKVKLNSLAMPVIESNITDPEFKPGTDYPPMTLTLNTDDIDPALFGCFLQGKPLTVQSQDERVMIKVKGRIPVGRSRINCTAPSQAQTGRYYWYSQPFFVAQEDGRWRN